MYRLEEGKRVYQDGIDYMRQYAMEFPRATETQNDDFFELLELGRLLIEADDQSPDLSDAIQAWKDRLLTFSDFYETKEEEDEFKEPQLGKKKRRSVQKHKSKSKKQYKSKSKKRVHGYRK